MKVILCSLVILLLVSGPLLAGSQRSDPSLFATSSDAKIKTEQSQPEKSVYVLIKSFVVDLLGLEDVDDNVGPEEPVFDSGPYHPPIKPAVKQDHGTDPPVD